jgi:hypothetical protein
VPVPVPVPVLVLVLVAVAFAVAVAVVVVVVVAQPSARDVTQEESPIHSPVCTMPASVVVLMSVQPVSRSWDKQCG